MSFRYLAGLAVVALSAAAAADTPCTDALKRTCEEVAAGDNVDCPSGCTAKDRACAMSVANETAACEKLASQAVTEHDDAANAAANAAAGVAADTLVSTQEVQPANRGFSGAQGSPAQVEAVPSVTPTSSTAADLALVGTRGGFRIVANAALNPTTLVSDLVSGSTRQAPKTFAIAARTFDLAVVLPINPTAAGTPGTNAFDYIGVRLRANILGALSGSRVTDNARNAYSEALNKLHDQLNAAGKFQSAALKLIKGAAEKYACRKALGQSSDTAIATACNASAGKSLSELLATDAALREALTAARNEADKAYLGVDARFDYGDPTFSQDPSARGTYLLVAAAGGYRWTFGPASRGHVGVQFRLGASYAQLPAVSPNVSFDFAGGLELGMVNDLRETNLSVGLEGRNSHDAPMTADTNYIDMKLGLAIPLSDGAKLGIGVGFPLKGTHGTTVSFSGNWAGLLSALTSSK